MNSLLFLSSLIEVSFKLEYTLITSILFSVKVPVLSVHITSVDPSVSIAAKFLTIDFFLAIWLTPIDRVAVIAIGKHSGTLATIIEIHNIIIFIKV